MINKKLKTAAILMIIHGAMIEAIPSLLMMPSIASGLDGTEMPPIFAIDFFKDNLMLMMPMAVMFGITRVIGAIGVLKNRMWGFYLSVINCVITMNLMLFMIPSGIADGILACSALILLLIGYFGKQTIR